MGRQRYLPCQAVVFWARKGKYRKNGTMCMNRADYVRDGRACCFAHNSALNVEWYTDRVIETLAKVRLRQLNKELERRAESRRLSEEALIDRIQLLYPVECGD